MKPIKITNMTEQVLHDDKPAVKIDAVLIREAPSGKSALYDCEGDEVWVPHSVSNYNPDQETLIIQEWFYNQLVEEGKL